MLLHTTTAILKTVRDLPPTILNAAGPSLGLSRCGGGAVLGFLCPTVAVLAGVCAASSV